MRRDCAVAVGCVCIGTEVVVSHKGSGHTAVAQFIGVCGMVVVRLCVEACASMKLPFLHEIRAKTMKKYPASQPVFTSDKRLYIARTSQRIRP